MYLLLSFGLFSIFPVFLFYFIFLERERRDRNGERPGQACLFVCLFVLMTQSYRHRDLFCRYDAGDFVNCV